MDDNGEALRDDHGIGRRIAAIRRERRIKLADLSKDAGVSPSMISQIERGRALPSVKTLYSVADALGTPVQSLLVEPAPLSPDTPQRAKKPKTGPPPGTPAAADGSADLGAGDRVKALRHGSLWSGASPNGPVVRSGQGQFAEMAGGIRWDRITPSDLPDAAVLVTTYPPGAASSEELYRHQGREVHLAIEGRIVVELRFERYELGPGDSITFDSSEPHRYSNPFEETARGVTFLLHADPSL